MIIKLIVTKGEDDGKIFHVRPGESKIIGRSSKTDITIHDVGVSRLHCEVHHDAEAASVADMNSRNGTSVNGHRIIDRHALNDRDVITLGMTDILVRLQSDDAGPITAEPSAAGASPLPVEPADEPVLPPIVDAAPEPAPQPAAPAAEAPAEIMGSFDRWLGPDGGPPGADRQAAAGPLLEPIVDRQPAPPSDVEPAPAAPAAEPSGAPDRIGMAVGGCRIEELLGRDETSEAYRAVQVSMDRPVMLKVLTPEMTRDARAVQRFLRAARAGGRLSHPNIVQVYDAGEDRGLNFIAFEFVEGESVKRLLQKQGRGKPLPLRQSVDIAEQIAGALDYAHGAGVVHRNIKIDNIYVTRHGVAKLADMGFAKPLIEDGARPGTLAGERLGDLFFAAPEQLADAGSAGPAADVYSLGAVLFVMLTGHLPFHATDEAQVMERVQRGERESVQRLNPSVPEAVCRTVDRAMALDPARRYRHAGEMQSALRAAREP